MSEIRNLEPQSLWGYFDDLCKIPRPSKKEEKVIAFLMDWAKQHNIEAVKDEVGNILMKKPATPGMGNKKTIIMQSHMDMVCEKNNDTVHDFDNDPIKPYIDGEWVKAKGTTLGADDGIGVAAQMDMLTANDVKHGNIECLFTVDEETGLTGAFALKPNFFEAEILLNLDSEDDGEIFIGCAGGIDTVASTLYTTENTPSNSSFFKINITGLKGGHSGDEIDKGHGNSNKILNRILHYSANNFGLRLNNFDGGNLRNAIPREASASFSIPTDKISEFKTFFNTIVDDIKLEFKIKESDLSITLSEINSLDFVIDIKTQNKLFNVIHACPHGVIAMSNNMEGMVSTSTNLASVKFKDNNIIEITTSQRSDSESMKTDIAEMVKSVFELADYKIIQEDGYPGWEPNPNSKILDIARNSYVKLFNTEPIVRSIHAGLECGLFLEKYPNLDMVSFGPTLKEVHSPAERVLIPTVEKFRKHLVDILENAPEK